MLLRVGHHVVEVLGCDLPLNRVEVGEKLERGRLPKSRQAAAEILDESDVDGGKEEVAEGSVDELPPVKVSESIWTLVALSSWTGCYVGAMGSIKMHVSLAVFLVCGWFDFKCEMAELRVASVGLDAGGVGTEFDVGSLDGFKVWLVAFFMER
jgi:hypothetical protein